MNHFGKYDKSYISHFHPNTWYDETPYFSSFKTFIRNGKFARNMSPHPTNIIIQSCIVCHKPIQANWMTDNIQVHGHCFQHIYGEAIQLQNDNNRLREEVSQLRDQVEDLKMNIRIKDFYEKSNAEINSIKSPDRESGYASLDFGSPISNEYSEHIAIASPNTKFDYKYYDKTIAYKVAVGNLPVEQLDTTKSVLKETFSKFGTINKIWVNPINKLYGYIEFEKKHSAENATQSMNGQRFLGKILEVEMPFKSLENLENTCPENIEAVNLQESENDCLNIISNSKAPNGNHVEVILNMKQDEEKNELIISEQENKIKNLKLIVDSQKQVIMKYRNTLKNYEEKSDYGTFDSNISLSKSSSTLSHRSILKDISNEMKQEILLLKENIQR